MQLASDLKAILTRIDGRGYKAYKDIKGSYQLEKGITLIIDHVQGDPFAAPSEVRVRVDQQLAGFPAELFNNRIRKIALQDFLSREFNRQIQRITQGRRGSGKSGLIAIETGGQEVLPRTSVEVSSTHVEARFAVGLPARGRRVLGQQAAQMLLDEVPRIARNSLLYPNYQNKQAVIEFINVVEDQHHLRQILREHNLVAFIANGSVLPRESGVSDKPLSGPQVVPFVSPPELEIALPTLHHGTIRGMGIPAGVTLIVGGGYHGKSTLLKAIERGVYNHVPGDGRERVVTVSSAVKIRAEDGRSVRAVDISNFISNLPQNIDTTRFSTPDASGSTSQAANIVEALEIGSKLLLVDEDTSATNFMIRDKRMQALVHKDHEPITPFIDRVRQLHRQKDVSTILVIGGSGDYFDVADTVIAMESYRPICVTDKARQIAEQYPTERKSEVSGAFEEPVLRILSKKGLNPRSGRKVKIKVRGKHIIQYGTETIDLSFVEQLVDTGQTKAIANMIYFAAQKLINQRRTMADVVAEMYRILEKEGLEVLSPFEHPANDLAWPRPYEFAAALNRLRSLTIVTNSGSTS